jgi:hypothetical protein
MFRDGQKVRLRVDVTIEYIDPKFDGPSLSPQDYARICDSLRLVAGTIGAFGRYWVHIPSLNILTPSTKETGLCDVVLGRALHYCATMSPDALELADAAAALTPLGDCVDVRALEGDHYFRREV